MLNLIVGIIIGIILGAGGVMAIHQPKDVFGTIRKGVDKVEEMQIEKCKREEASCYLSKSQAECDKQIKEKCGG